MEDKKDLKKLEKKLGIIFNNKNLLRQALVHRSFLNENANFDLEHNERLEFLGDAVLEFVVTEYLYENYKKPEGELTNWRAALVKGQMLAKIAKDLSIGNYLYLSRGEELSGGRSRELILANVFEALIGAIYIDQGMEVVKKFVRQHLLSKLNEVLAKKLYVDPKSKLQEITQETLGVAPVYQVLEESGPDHAKLFTVGVYINNKLTGKGSGPSKQNAEETAALSALKVIQKE